MSKPTIKYKTAEKMREACALKCEGLIVGAEMAVNLDISLGEQERFLVWIEALSKTAKAIRTIDINEVLSDAPNQS